MSLYQVLEVSQDASPDEIKAGYQRLVRQYHPDKTRVSDSDRFTSIRTAYETLSNPRTKYQYDETLRDVVAELLPLSEFEHIEEDSCYEYPCRCGDVYFITEEDVAKGPHQVVQCGGCSLYVRISGSLPSPRDS
jgi:diphthamide biosynthesis protein 4